MSRRASHDFIFQYQTFQISLTAFDKCIIHRLRLKLPFVFKHVEHLNFIVWIGKSVTQFLGALILLLMAYVISHSCLLPSEDSQSIWQGSEGVLRRLQVWKVGIHASSSRHTLTLSHPGPSEVIYLIQHAKNINMNCPHTLKSLGCVSRSPLACPGHPEAK